MNSAIRLLLAFLLVVSYISGCSLMGQSCLGAFLNKMGNIDVSVAFGILLRSHAGLKLSKDKTMEIEPDVLKVIVVIRTSKAPAHLSIVQETMLLYY